MREISWHPDAWDEYIEMQSRQPALLKRVNKLIKDIQRNGYKCSIGKAEMLKGDLSGYASVRIDRKNRLVFQAADDEITIIKCGGHYNDK